MPAAPHEGERRATAHSSQADRRAHTGRKGRRQRSTPTSQRSRAPQTSLAPPAKNPDCVSPVGPLHASGSADPGAPASTRRCPRRPRGVTLQPMVSRKSETIPCAVPADVVHLCVRFPTDRSKREQISNQNNQSGGRPLYACKSSRAPLPTFQATAESPDRDLLSTHSDRAERGCRFDIAGAPAGPIENHARRPAGAGHRTCDGPRPRLQS